MKKHLKIINDPVYGFIRIPSSLILELIEHPYFQRLRYIKQLGMTHLVYPGALHTRFHHAIGAMHLMQLAIETLRNKGQLINEEEEEGALIAILLHDIGHGPFSHALEHTIVSNISHETLSQWFMNKLNEQFAQQLTIAIAIFNHQYPKKFLSQLISGQLDLDRLDYLNRDSFFTGVAEGVVGFDRIIAMLDVKNNQLVIEEKGIYSVEKFLIARRLMYWQVYFHKTVIAAEQLLIKILKRAKYLALEGEKLFATPSLSYFLHQEIAYSDFLSNTNNLTHFSHLDDHDIFTAIKVWAEHTDPILSHLCHNLIYRHLYHIEIKNEPFSKAEIKNWEQKTLFKFMCAKEDISYFTFTDTIKNNAYNIGDTKISILSKNNNILDITQASDNTNLEALAKTVQKYFLCYDKSLIFN